VHPAAVVAAPLELDRVAHQLDAASHVVHLAAHSAAPADAAGELLAEALGARPADPLFAFDAYLLHLRAQSERLVVVIEDLDALPAPTAAWLRRALDRSRGALCALAGAPNPSAAERAAARLGLALHRPAPREPALPRYEAWLGLGGSALLAVLLAGFAWGWW
jgi:hypothetical protein